MQLEDTYVHNNFPSSVIDSSLPTLARRLAHQSLNNIPWAIIQIRDACTHTVVKILPNNSLNNTGEMSLKTSKGFKNKKKMKGCDRSMVSQE